MKKKPESQTLPEKKAINQVGNLGKTLGERALTTVVAEAGRGGGGGNEKNIKNNI